MEKTLLSSQNYVGLIPVEGKLFVINGNEVPIHLKMNLTVEEAVQYSNIGENTLREEIAKPHCPFVVKIGSRKLIKRKEFEKWNSEQYRVR